MHGANRLGGNSLMETITFGRRAGQAAADWALSHTTVEITESVERDAERELGELLGRTDGERPWKIRDELGASMLENFGVFRREEKMLSQLEIIDGLRGRYENVYVEDKGEIFNSDLTQAIELGYLLDLAACMLQAGVARKESRGAHSRPYDYPKRDDQRFLKHSITRWVDGAPRAHVQGRAVHAVRAGGAQVLMQVALKIWRYDSSTGDRALEGVRDRRAR